MEQKCLLLTMVIKRTIDYWSLSTAFDVSTATFDGAFSISGQEARANTIAFNNDGTRMFIAGVGKFTTSYS